MSVKTAILYGQRLGALMGTFSVINNIAVLIE